MKITILSEAEIRQCVAMDEEAFAAVADGFSSLTAGKATVPPIMRVDIDDRHGEVDIKTAYIRGLNSFAIKIAAGFSENRGLGLPTGSGMMVVVSSRTGFPEAILLDNGYLTDLRTGIAGGLAARYLARQNIETAGVIGSGMQARYQIMALKKVRAFKRLMVYGILKEEVARYALDMSEQLNIEVIQAESAEAVVRNSDAVVTCTPSRRPYLQPDWLHPGLHITAMGSDAEEKQELFAATFARADILACDSKSQCLRLGELHHGFEAGVITEQTPVIELGQLTSGAVPGRRNESDITICDLTGVGVQDTAIALLAYGKALQKNLGMQMNA